MAQRAPNHTRHRPTRRPAGSNEPKAGEEAGEKPNCYPSMIATLPSGTVRMRDWLPFPRQLRMIFLVLIALVAGAVVFGAPCHRVVGRAGAGFMAAVNTVVFRGCA